MIAHFFGCHSQEILISSMTKQNSAIIIALFINIESTKQSKIS